jgi:NAD(P)-dependent dehydrogenase (short-subunit alcohol dehydrogenase family)
MTLAGKTAFISGASRGIGLAIAKRVAGPMARSSHCVTDLVETDLGCPGCLTTALPNPFRPHVSQTVSAIAAES